MPICYFSFKGLVVVQILSFVVLSFVFIWQYGIPPIMKVLKPLDETKEEKEYRWGSYVG